MSHGWKDDSMLVKRLAVCRLPIYLQPFLIYSELLVENCDIFRPHLCLEAPQGVTPLEFREDLHTHKTRMNGPSCGEESMTICSAVLIQYQRVTDGRTDRQTDVQPISITCFSIADARNNRSMSTAGQFLRSPAGPVFRLDHIAARGEIQLKAYSILSHWLYCNTLKKTRKPQNVF